MLMVFVDMISSVYVCVFIDSPGSHAGIVWH
jgi:hypothetical protein